MGGGGECTGAPSNPGHLKLARGPGPRWAEREASSASGSASSLLFWLQRLRRNGCPQGLGLSLCVPGHWENGKGRGDWDVLTEVGNIQVAENLDREFFIMWWEVSKAEVGL